MVITRRSLVAAAIVLVSSCSGPPLDNDPIKLETSALVTGAQKLGVPIYNPGWTPITSAPAGGIVILDPEDSGPGGYDHTEYHADVLAAHDAGIAVYGYVSTQWGARAPALVDLDIQHYKDWYDTLSGQSGLIAGIFLDEVETGSTPSQYYIDRRTTVLGTDSTWKVALNPGTAVPQTFLSVGDIIVTYESDNYIEEPSFFMSNDYNYPTRAWERNAANAGRIWHMATSVPDGSRLAIAIDRARQRNAGTLYVFNLTTNDYGDLASYYATEAAIVDKYNNPGTSQVKAGFVRSQSLTGSTTNDGTYSWNSTGAANSVTWYGTGWYFVDFGNLGGAGGVAHVSAVGTGGERCVIWDQGQEGAAARVWVDCTNAAGNYVDAYFTASFTWRSGAPGAGEGYAIMADSPSTPSYVDQRGWSSIGGFPAIDKLSGPAGRYSIVFPSNTRQFSSITEVTAWEQAPGHFCGPTGGGITFAGTYLDVPYHGYAGAQCFDAAGQPVDERFNVTFSTGSPNGSPSYYWVSTINTFGGGIGYGIYGSWGYISNPAHAITATAATLNRVPGVSSGAFYVDLPEVTSGARSNAIVSAQDAARNCEIEGWTAGPSGGTRVTVRCFTASGTLADSKFNLVYSTNQ
jgi:hypothetical protein